ncbi:MAG: hypothetical protein BMS9Abin37_1494 [Acidobacteriota bacterium]|nr:MAG: hypothetical protein BMS9Abin37_1494 [Acidobacteriota bacterium]
MRRSLLFLLVTLAGVTAPRAEERFQWKGRVDGADDILIRRRFVRIDHLGAKPIQFQDYRFSASLPARAVEVELHLLEGRGTVRLMEQPSRRNDYTVVVRIEDGRGGASDYEFEIVWDEDDGWGNDWGRDGSHNVRWNDDPDGDDGVFRWKGRVDVGAEIEIRGGGYTVTNLGGQGVREDRVEFESSLPERDVPVSLRKFDGRGDVELIQAPDAKNGYSAIIRIEDDKRGADNYELELRWRR